MVFQGYSLGFLILFVFTVAGVVVPAKEISGQVIFIASALCDFGSKELHDIRKDCPAAALFLKLRAWICERFSV